MTRTIVNELPSDDKDESGEWDLSNDWEDDQEVEQWTAARRSKISRPRSKSMPFSALPSKRGGPLAKYLDEDKTLFKVSRPKTPTGNIGVDAGSKRRHTITVIPKVQQISKSMSSKLYEDQTQPLGSFEAASCPSLNYTHDNHSSNESVVSKSPSSRNECKTTTIQIKEGQWGAQQFIPKSPKRSIKPSLSDSGTSILSNCRWNEPNHYRTLHQRREGLSERASRTADTVQVLSPAPPSPKHVTSSPIKKPDIPTRRLLEKEGSVPPIPPAFAVIASCSPKKQTTKTSGAESKKPRTPSRSKPRKKILSITPDGFPAQVDDSPRDAAPSSMTKAEPVLISPGSPKKVPAWVLLREQRASLNNNRQRRPSNASITSMVSTEPLNDTLDERSMQSSLRGSFCESQPVTVTPHKGDGTPPTFSPSFFKLRMRTKNSNGEERLTWTLRPVDNFSDWKIVVRTRVSSEKTKKAISTKITYHVHRNIIGVGSRRSSYFLNAFKKSSKSVEAATLIELKSSAARAFPSMLDYIYGINALEITTATAVALRHLGDHFGVPSMFNEANDFIQQDMNVENIHIYLQEGIQFEDEKLVDAAISFAARELKGLTSDEGASKGEYAQIMDVLSPKQQLELFRRALKTTRQSRATTRR